MFRCEMKSAAVEMIWANVMRMVAGLRGDSEPVKVEFFPLGASVSFTLSLGCY